MFEKIKKLMSGTIADARLCSDADPAKAIRILRSLAEVGDKEVT